MQESLFVLELQLAVKLEDLRMFLEGRFGPLPADLLSRIEATTELAKIDQLLRAAPRISGLEDLPV